LDQVCIAGVNAVIALRRVDYSHNQTLREDFVKISTRSYCICYVLLCYCCCWYYSL